MRWLTGQCSWTTMLGHIEPELYNIFLQQEALKLPIYKVFVILKDVTMTWQKWGSKQALEKRKTSLSLMEVFNIALKCRVFRF
jgi:hypothetical protein